MNRGQMIVDARLPEPTPGTAPLRSRVKAAWRTLLSSRGNALAADAHATRPRYGHGLPAHPGLLRIVEQGRSRYRATLQSILAYGDQLAAIARRRDEPSSLEPTWENDFLPGLDAAALYAMVARTAPRRYIEVGSGNSTMFVRRAIRDHGLKTTITSIDPMPRADIDAICDRVIRSPLAEVDVQALLDAEAGDIVFLDGSHLVFTGSDVTVAFLDVLPYLRPGVIVQIHDIWLPYDYPARWASRMYAEQYMLAVALLAAPRRYEVLFPAMFIASDPELRAELAPLWSRPELRGVPEHGGSFWMRIDGATGA